MSDPFLRRVRALMRCVVVGFLLLAGPALAADQPSNPAAAHFARGVDLVKQGDLEGAAREFETAHGLSPHPAVLYNLGQTYASLGQPVEAVRALKRYLAEVNDVTSARREEVTALIAFHEKRIGKLAISVQPAGVDLLLDGHPVAKGEASSALEVAAGTHTLLARKDGYVPIAMTQVVRPGETAELSLALEAVRTSPQARFDFACLVPEAAVYVDGVYLGKAPLQRPVNAGRHQVTFARDGYDSVPLSVPAAGAVTVTCQLSPSSRLSATSGARLRLVGAPPRSTILVDGQRYSGQLLPAGQHLVLVESHGYRSWTDSVTLPRGRTTVLELELTATPEQRRRLEAVAKSRRRSYAYVGAGVGAALCGVAGLLHAVNSKRYREYSADSEELSRQLSSRAATPRDFERLDELSAEATAIERMDYLALTTGVLGIAALGGSVALYISGRPSEVPAKTGAVLTIRGLLW